MKNKQKFISIDLETTGLDSKKDSIIEVGLILFDIDQEIERYSSLVFYDKKLSGVVKRITNIDESELLKAPKIDEVLEKIKEYYDEDVIVVGHNIDFDLAFLQEAGLDMAELKKIDSWYLASILIFNIKSYSLEYLSRMIRWEYNAHRALDDAIAVKVLLVYLFDLMKTIPQNTRDKINEVCEKGDWSYGFVFDLIWADGEIKESKKFISSGHTELNIDSEEKKGKWFVEKSFGEMQKELNSNEELVVLSQVVFDRLQKENFADLNYFDTRRNYICRERLKLTLRKHVLDNDEIGVLVKILVRVSKGYWDGLIKQINLSRTEYNKKDIFRCDGSICHGNCYFDNRLGSILDKKIGIVGTYSFAKNNFEKIKYENLKIWSENILLEDGISNILSEYYNLNQLVGRLEENLENEVELSKRKKIEEVYKKVKILSNGFGLMVRSKANKTDYGSFLDITPMTKNDLSFISVVNQSKAIIEYVDNDLEQVAKEILGLCDSLVDNSDNIIKIWLDSRDELKITILRKVFKNELLDSFENKNILLSARSISNSENYYGEKYFSEGYEYELKNVEGKLEDVEKSTNEVGLDIEYFAEKDYNLAVFSSKKKVDAYYDYYHNKASEKNLTLFREKKKFMGKGFEKGIILCAYSELGQLQLDRDVFDFVYLNDLMFDVPGEVTTTTRSMAYEDNSFLKYSLPRMMLRFRFVLSLLKEGGKLAVGDKRFYHKSYGQTIRDKLDLKWI